jgi:hypothetical protein
MISKMSMCCDVTRKGATKHVKMLGIWNKPLNFDKYSAATKQTLHAAIAYLATSELHANNLDGLQVMLDQDSKPVSHEKIKLIRLAQPELRAAPSTSRFSTRPPVKKHERHKVHSDTFLRLRFRPPLLGTRT